MYDTRVYLVQKTVSTVDDIGQETFTEAQNPVFAEQRSITQTEWRAASEQGLKPEMVLVTSRFDYNGEDMCMVNGIKYGIYRTYQKNGREIELYLERKIGVES